MFGNLILAIGSAWAAFALWPAAGDWRWLAGGFGMLSLWQAYCAVSASRVVERIVLRLGGFAWSEEDFCRGWLIIGETGSGKTLGVINPMLWQISKHCHGWGGICIDDKGLYWETLSEMFEHLGRKEDLLLLQVRPDDAPRDWRPPATFNYLSYPRLPFSAKAKDACDVGASLGQGGDQSFFRVQAEIQMEFAFQALCCAELPVTLSNAHELLSSDRLLKEVLELLADKNSAEARALLQHYESFIANQPPEQFGGVRGTLANRLKHFTDPDIAAVFCSASSSVSLDDMDRGKVICVSVPQRYKVERRYIKTLMKLAYFSHVQLRFDQPRAQRAKNNLLIMWGDEAQKIVTSNDDGTSDYNVVDVIREARATYVAATQSYTSLIPPMGDERKAKVFIANMANRVFLKSADEDTAKLAADTIGKRRVKKRTYGWSAGKRTTSWTEEEKYFIEPHEFRRLRKFHAVVQHCERGFRRVVLPPLGTDGKISSWYRY